jgi:hypothetical protein
MQIHASIVNFLYVFESAPLFWGPQIPLWGSRRASLNYFTRNRHIFQKRLIALNVVSTQMNREMLCVRISTIYERFTFGHLHINYKFTVLGCDWKPSLHR